MKKLLCICALVTMHIQATESAGAAGQVERKVEVAKAKGRTINKEATDELFALVQVTDENHPIDLDYVQQLIDEGADVNAVKKDSLFSWEPSKSLLATALQRDIVNPEFYKHIIQTPGYNKFELTALVESVTKRMRNNEEYLLGEYKDKNIRMQQAKRFPELLRYIEKNRRELESLKKVKTVMQEVLIGEKALVKQRSVDTDATYELYDLIYTKPDNQTIDLGEVKRLLDQGAAVNDELLSVTPIHAALDENLAIPELYRMMVETTEYDPTVKYYNKTALDEVNRSIGNDQKIIAQGYIYSPGDDRGGQVRARALRNQEKWQEIKRILEDASVKYNAEQAKQKKQQESQGAGAGH